MGEKLARPPRETEKRKHKIILCLTDTKKRLQKEIAEELSESEAILSPIIKKLKNKGIIVQERKEVGFGGNYCVLSDNQNVYKKLLQRFLNSRDDNELVFFLESEYHSRNYPGLFRESLGLDISITIDDLIITGEMKKGIIEGAEVEETKKIIDHVFRISMHAGKGIPSFVDFILSKDLNDGILSEVLIKEFSPLSNVHIIPQPLSEDLKKLALIIILKSSDMLDRITYPHIQKSILRETFDDNVISQFYIPLRYNYNLSNFLSKEIESSGG